ncbi:2-(1,2-epoxy-1,2-dihydrophenyl)acetyl-CoA isomerase [Labrys miyagiensis]|uniref:2-(1,2-epoxy-1,2-dihydrophenyl)acetyl-CoA isomerase n=1 Tax=Labrys miyagiensis TaxID=346912 RepID=A0ABQ6CQQ4_9HYPH|nr:enoyl-CoA hydratase-related protein [Labrys miyagiensis]GLS22155.1 2-(1,2-epoxy-1,2-dihydrophenyl)acetyl-CoA isomerase [Labrys miyagiensis]
MNELVVENAGPVRTLTLNRPAKLNAFTASLHAELREALALAMQDDGVKAVVLTGSGRAFSSGQDLTEELPRDAAGRIDLGPALERDYNPLIKQIVAAPKPIIAALNGPAVGAAMNIALACDIVLAARSASLQEAFARIGLIPDAGGTWLLPRLTGPRRALALMLTAEPVPAEEALRLGLVYKVYEDADFAADVAAFAEKLARGPALAYRLIREAVFASDGNDLDAQLALEAALQQKAGASRDFQEGVAAFLEKRPPRFEGR